MFSEFNQDQLSLLDIKQDFFQHLKCDVSRTALHKKFNINTVKFLKELHQTYPPSLINTRMATDDKPP